MIDTSQFEFKVFYDFNKEEGKKEVIFKNNQGNIVEKVKYRTRKVKSKVNDNEQ